MTDWTVVIPMAGRGSRLKSTLPKPLALVGGQTMVSVALNSLDLPGQYIFVVQKAHEAYGIEEHLMELRSDCSIVWVDGVTDGPASSVLAAREYLDDKPLLIANVDQKISWSSTEFRSAAQRLDGLIAVHPSTDPKYSYALVKDGLVIRTAEKNPISNQATCGIYWWGQGIDFISSAEEMIRVNERVNGEFYVTPTYNYAIASGLRVGTYSVKEMQDMGLG